MSFYDFKCPECGIIKEFEVSPREIAEFQPKCRSCDKKLTRMFAAPLIKVAFRAGHDPYTGQNFDSQLARDNFIARNELVKGNQ